MNTYSQTHSQKPEGNRARDVCHRCGHWARNCKDRKNWKTTTDQYNPVSKANPLMQGKPKVKVYIKASYRGKVYKVLVDTGCDVSVLSTKVLPDI